MIQGKIERYHRSLKNVAKLQTYHFPWQLEQEIASFVESFNGRFRDESLNEEVFASAAEARTVIERWRQDYN